MNQKLVIAEDEADIRNNILRLLRLEGYEAWAAPNGRQAWELVQQHQPDLVLSDVMMPEMTGHQLVQSIRANAHTAHIPVILLTALADRQDVRAGMNLGADDYIVKPFQRDELLESIRARLEKSLLQRESASRLASQTHRLMHFDPVTDLANRAHFLLLLENCWNNPASAQARLWGVSVDNLTHMAQVIAPELFDTCIKCMSDRLVQVWRDSGHSLTGRYSLGRIGDDRFAVLVEDAADLPDLDEVSHKLISSLSLPLKAANDAHYPVVSMASLDLTRASGINPRNALGLLDLALVDARGQAGEKVTHIQPESSNRLDSSLRLHNDLHRAVENSELRSHYQPQIDAKTCQVVGFEALIRWEHPTHGLVSPARFIPMAEDNGQIIPMGAWILKQACTDLLTLQNILGSNLPLRVGVNLSMRQFMDPGILNTVRTALDESGMNPRKLELEITEGTAMVDVEKTIRLLGEFKSLGVKLSLDDFGTGYSSLSYLKRFPLDVLKIDQSFVRNLHRDSQDRAIAGAVIDLSHRLDLRVIAEGVEEQHQHDVLRDMGCDEIQGYLHGRPMALQVYPQWLQNRQRG
ncbi:MAG: putative bifunctional diguanylate cyclase/phosphodiesterase [Acidovorax sp.]